LGPGIFILLAGLIAFWMIPGGLVIPFLNLFFHQEHNLAVERVGVLFAIAQLVGAATIFLGGELSARFGASRMLLIWTLLYGPLLWLLAATSALSIAILLFVVQGIVAPATNALIDQLLMERAPSDRRGAVSSWRNAATEGSGFLGSGAGGRLLEQGGFGLVLGVAGAIALAGAVLLNAAFRWTRGSVSDADSAAQQPEEPLAVDVRHRSL
jgi:MFS family permease